MATPEQAEKRHEHIAVAKAADWKYTPQKPNKGVPVPYWTVSYFDEAVNTAGNSNGRRNDYFISVSRVPTSRGGEAGKGKGVLSNAYMDEFEPKEWSNTLQIDQGKAVFHGHMGTINKGNAPAKVYTNVNPAAAIADRACWEQLQTNMAALGVASKDRMFADPAGCGKDVISGAWNQVAGDVQAAGDLLGSLWGGITAFFSDPLGTAGKAVDGLKKFGTQAYEAGKQVVSVVEGLRNGSITMQDLLDFAGDMLQDGLCDVARQVEEMVKNGKGCEAVGMLLGIAAEQVAIAVATAGAGAAASGAAKGAQVLAKAGIGKGDDIAAAIKKLKDFKKRQKDGHGDGHKPPADPGKKDSSTPGSKAGDACPLCPVVGNPVNPVLGVKVQAGAEELDFELPAPLPLPWQRTYVSSNAHVGWLGQGWTTPLGIHLEERRTQRGPQWVLVDEFGRDIVFPTLRPGESHFHEYEQITLTALETGWLELSPPDQSQHLLLGRLAGQTRRYVLRAIVDRNDNIIRIDYGDDGLPRHITDSAGRVLGLHFETLGTPPADASRRGAAQRLTRIDLLAGPGQRDQPPARTNGQALVVYRYDAGGDLIAVIDRQGQTCRQFEYSNHILTAHTLRSGVRVQYFYDRTEPDGHVLSSQSSTGAHYRFDYRDGHTVVTDQLGRVETYEFDARRQWTGHIDAQGGHTVRELDAFGNLVALTDPAGRTTRYAYDGQGRPVRVQSPQALGQPIPVTSLHHDPASGQVARIISPDGAVTRYRYDERGNLVEAVDALGHSTRYQYDARGLPIAIIDALGKTKHLRYDQTGQLVQYTDCSGQSTHYGYDGWGHIATVTDALGHTTRYQHDALGRLQAVLHPDGAQESFAYDAAGRLVTYTDPLGHTTQYSLAPDGLPLSRRNAEGGELRYEYDSARRLRALFNENNARYDFAYDSLDRLVEETGFDGRNTRYRYDPTGLILAKLENGCLTPQQRLDKRLAQEAGPASPGLPAQRSAPTLDDPWGLGLADETAPLAAPPGHAIATRYLRDAAGRLVEKQVAGSVLDAQEQAQPQYRTTRYAYDEIGRLLEATNGQGSRTRLAYDLLGQLLEETRTGQGLHHSLRHQYDALGNRTQTQLPTGQRLHWLYYGSGHLHQINLDGQVISDMERDALHRETQRTQGALHSRYGYDALGRLTAQAAWRMAAGGAGPGASAPQRPGAWQALGDEVDPKAAHGRPAPAGAPVLGRRYQYDLAGNLASIQDSRHGSTRYQYDRIGRILAATQPGLAERFAFDPAHNMLPVEGANPQGGKMPSTGFIKDNRLEVFEDKRYRYDTHGNLIEKKVGKHTVIALEWDVEHQLRKATVTKAAHTARPVTTATSYRYDAFGRRLEKKDAFGQTRFEWDGNRLLSEQRGSHHQLYVYEADSFAPLAQVDLLAKPTGQPSAQVPAPMEPDPDHDEDDWQPRKAAQALGERMQAFQQQLQARVKGAPTQEAPPAEGEQPANVVRLKDWRVRYYHNDHLGTPRELSDEGGTIVWQAAYRAWGNTLKVEAAPLPQNVDPKQVTEIVEQNLRFQGQYFDEENGLHYNRFRYYEPDVGRFISQDPIGLDGGQNLYQYAPNPNGWIDPWGTKRSARKSTSCRPCPCSSGAQGEAAAIDELKNSGKFKNIWQIQNNSGHGVDIIAERWNGNIVAYEVKTQVGNTGFPSLSQAQKGGQTFVESRLGRAAGGNGQWVNVATGVKDTASDLLDKIRSGGKISGGILQVDCSKGTVGKIFDKKWF
ncbi:Cell wall-associated polypeptide CWBP200 [Delftia tsuruhatensis]|uniref:RHS repeat-associated core domain-containing protein n=1 Tax=Delftia tsuruhatensis TaxID=180282 RepID=UPI001E7C6E24|nr:RHS repeat-associated core domain-containing protein [Delftia tsuruhatensis]CAB5707770.1 Cell wall-associated polypeptide CWBP200 [Delftia tsuruhatensis]CAC9685028.1 Cell wall-associated polypeptide CWBP200 [Delftia tsuruhatensis]